MAGLDPAIQTFFGSLALARWMAASRAAMEDKAMIQFHQIVVYQIVARFSYCARDIGTG